MLNSYNSGLEWVDDVVRSVKDGLRVKDGGVELHIEYMDTKRVFNEEYLSKLFDLYKTKFKDVQFSLILVSDNHALDFIIKHRDNLFGKVPVVFCGVNFFKDSKLNGLIGYTGVAEVFDARATVELALKLHPETTNVYVINDYLKTGVAWKLAIKEQLAGLEDKVKITYSPDIPINDVITEIKSLPPTSFILLGVFFQDNEGRFYTPMQSTTMFSSLSEVPVYGLLDFDLGHGIVGGKLISGYYQGKKAAELGRRILDGQSPASIPVIKEGANVYMFDALQLRRFSISQSELPAESEVINNQKLEFTPDELKWLSSNMLLRLAPDPFFPPVEFFDSGNVYSGIAADYMKLLEDKLNIKFDIVRLNNWDEVLEAAKANKIDILGAATPTTQRSEYMLFTQPYVEFPAVIIVRKQIKEVLSVEKLRGKTVSVVSGYPINDYLEERYPDIKLDIVKSVSEGLGKVSFGEVYAMIENVATSTYYIEKEGITNLHVAGQTGYYYELAIASRKDWPELNSILDKGLSLITQKERNQVYRKWVNLNQHQWRPSKGQIWIFIVTLFVLIVVAVLVWNYSLRREVRKRNRLLQYELDRSKKLSDAIEAVNTQQALILENTRVGIAYVKNSMLVWVNQRLSELLGLPIVELIGSDIKSFFKNMDDYTDVLNGFDTNVENSVSFDKEVIMKRTDSDTFVCHIVGKAAFEDDPDKGSIWIIDDITERKRTENELNKSRNQLRKLLELSPFPVTLTKLEDRMFVYINKKGEELFKVDGDNFTGLKFTDFFVNIEDEGQLLNSVRLTEYIDEFEVELKDSNGKTFWALMSVQLMDYDNHNCVFTALNNITHRKLMEEALRESENKFRDMFEKHNAVMLIVSPDSGQIIDANHSAEQFYGYNAHRLKRMSIYDINMSSPKDSEKLMRDFIANRKNLVSLQQKLFDGSEKYVDIHSTLITIGEKSCLFLIVHDITEKVEFEQKLEEQTTVLRVLIEDLQRQIEQKEKLIIELTNKK